VGVWQKPKSMRRAIAWDGIIPQRFNDWTPFAPSDIRAIRDYVATHRTTDAPFDIIAGGATSDINAPQASEHVRSFAEAGATWWVEGDMGSLSFEKLRERLRRGPPS